MSERLRFRLHIPPDELARFYQGAASSVIARAEDGRNVQFPANALRPFVTRSGVHGRFELELGAGQRLRALRRISD